MRRLFVGFLPVGLLVVGAVGWAGCGDDEEEEAAPAEAEVTAGERVQGGMPQGGEGCEAYCEKSNACAEGEGRAVPPTAQDCEASCAPGGLHAAAPPAAYACSDRPCGAAFRGCNMQAMMGHMREAEVDVFPPVCLGLCNKIARCAARTAQTAPDFTTDCDAACAPGGALAEVTEAELGCVHATCGAPFDRCRAEASEGE